MQHRRAEEWRAVAVPTEHGGWGFTLEPILLAQAVAPGIAGVGIAVAALSAFVARRPLRILVTDLRSRRRLPRTRAARRVAEACLAAAAAGLAAAVVFARAPWWWPLLAALPLAAVQVGADLTGRRRSFPAEASGALAMGAAAPMIALAHGWELAPAFGLWAVLGARDLVSILLVRAQIRRGRGEPALPLATHLAHAATLVALGSLAAVGVVPIASAPALAGLWVWAALSLARPPVPARTLGWTQVLAGLLVVAATAVGHHLGF